MKKCTKILFALLLAVTMLFVVGCQEQMIDGQVVQGSYTWLRDGETLEEEGLRFSIGELDHLTVNTIANNVNIGTHIGSDIVIEYVPDAPGSGRYYHHIIRPRYVYVGGHLEIFRDVNLANNTFIRGGTINILVPIHDGSVFESVSISTTNRDVNVSDFNANSLIIDSINTGVNVSNVNIENNLALQSTTGSIDVADSRIGGILSVATTNRNITLNNVETDMDNAELDVSHGDVVIN